MTRTTQPLTFGVEIETVNADPRDLINAINEAGLVAASATYGGRAYSTWQVKHDSSLHPTPGRDRGHTAEIVSPVLTWGSAADMRQIETVCRTINNLPQGTEARVNKSTGLHVHVGIAGFTRAEILGTVDVYTAYEPHIEREVLAPSRIGGQWAQSYRRWFTPERDRHDERFIATGQAGSRYMTVNLTRVNDIGTVEFRQRQGTTNARKILTWAGMAVNMVQQGRDVANGAPLNVASDLASSLRNHEIDAILESMLAGEFSLANLPTAAPSLLSQLLRLQGLEG